MSSRWIVVRRRTLVRLVALGTLVMVTLLACSGPESNDDSDPTPTTAPTATAAPTVTVTPTAERSPTAAETQTPEATETETESTAEPTASGTVSEDATAAATEDGTPQANQPSFEQVLPTSDMLPAQGFGVVNEGTRTAIELANAYTNPSEHLDRLNEWGFVEHYFREFTHQSTGAEDPLPSYVLTTGNAYGSPEQAQAALDWLQQQNRALGHTFVDPPPDLGDAASASTIDTAEGVPTAIIFVRIGDRLYAAFAQGGAPLPFVQQVAEGMVERANELANQ